MEASIIVNNVSKTIVDSTKTDVLRSNTSEKKAIQNNRQQLSIGVSSLEREKISKPSSRPKLITTTYRNSTGESRKMVDAGSLQRKTSEVNVGASIGSKSLFIGFPNTNQELFNDQQKSFDFDRDSNGSYDDDNDDQFYNNNYEEDNGDIENPENFMNKSSVQRTYDDKNWDEKTKSTTDNEDDDVGSRSSVEYVRDAATFDSRSAMFVVDWPTLTSIDYPRGHSISAQVLSARTVHTSATNVKAKSSSLEDDHANEDGRINSGRVTRSHFNDFPPPQSLAAMLSRHGKIARTGMEYWLGSIGDGRARELTSCHDVASIDNESIGAANESDNSSDCVTVHARNGGDYFSGGDDAEFDMVVTSETDDDSILADFDVGIQEAVVAIRKEASKVNAAIALDQVASMKHELHSTKLSLDERLDEIDELRALLQLKNDRLSTLELERDLYLADAEKLQNDLNTYVKRMRDMETEQNSQKIQQDPIDKSENATEPNSSSNSKARSPVVVDEDKVSEISEECKEIFPTVIFPDASDLQVKYDLYSDMETTYPVPPVLDLVQRTHTGSGLVEFQHRPSSTPSAVIVSPSPTSVPGFLSPILLPSTIRFSRASLHRRLFPDSEPFGSNQQNEGNDNAKIPFQPYNSPERRHAKRSILRASNSLSPTRLLPRPLREGSLKVRSKQERGHSSTYTPSRDDFSSSSSSSTTSKESKEPLLLSVVSITGNNKVSSKARSTKRNRLKGLKPIDLLERLCIPVRHSSNQTKKFSSNQVDTPTFQEEKEFRRNHSIAGLQSAELPNEQYNADNANKPYSETVPTGIIYQQHFTPPLSHKRLNEKLEESIQKQREMWLAQHESRIRLARMHCTYSKLINELVQKIDIIRKECTNKVDSIDQFHRSSIEELQAMILERDQEIKLLRSVL